MLAIVRDVNRLYLLHTLEFADYGILQHSSYYSNRFVLITGTIISHQWLAPDLQVGAGVGPRSGWTGLVVLYLQA